MRFAQFVIDDIKQNGMKGAEGFLGGDFYVESSRPMSEHFRGCPDSTDNPYAWDLYVDGFWIFKTVKLFRNSSNSQWFRISVERSEKQELLRLEGEYIKERKRKAEIKRQERINSEKKAQWYD